MQAKGVVEAVKEWLAKRSKSEPFYCGQCPKMEQCGLAPSETCLTKLEVLAIDTAAGTMAVQVVANKNCGYRFLTVDTTSS